LAQADEFVAVDGARRRESEEDEAVRFTSKVESSARPRSGGAPGVSTKVTSAAAMKPRPVAVPTTPEPITKIRAMKNAPSMLTAGIVPFNPA
jgi:hypothetical protein